jgi:uncharacterized membrane protein (DUF4010 family)
VRLYGRPRGRTHPDRADLLTPALALLAATGIGLLIGLERGWRQRMEHEGGRVAGIRTHALLGLGGGLSGLAATAMSPWFGLAGITGLIAVVAMAHRARLAEPSDNISATNAVVGIVTIFLGLAATSGFTREALIAGGLTASILSMRERLHGWLKTLSQDDIRAVGLYAGITLVVLPLLPDRPMGPYDALNPRTLWLVVVFVTGLSFAGYWASKKVGNARGTILAAAIGATYSSTAVTADLARRLRNPDEDAAVLNAAIAAASAMMPLRVTIICAALLPWALGAFVTGIGAAVALSVLYATIAIARLRGRDHDGGVALRRNPFDFWPAVGFAALVAAVVVAAHWTIDRFGDRGLTVLVALTGLYDVDAAIIMAGNLPRGAIAWADMGIILSVPILTNSVLKAVIVPALAGWRRGLTAALPLIIGAAAIVAGIALLSAAR